MIWIHLNVACISGTWFYRDMYDFEGCHGLFPLKTVSQSCSYSQPRSTAWQFRCHCICRLRILQMPTAILVFHSRQG